MKPFEEIVRLGGSTALEEASQFLMGIGPVHQALRNISQKLDDLGIPYAVVGGMALVAHGYERTTVDIDILITSEGLETARASLEGRGYVPVFQGSRSLRDTNTGVRIEFLLTGGFPGDGKPKPVAFPDPGLAGVEIGGIRYVNLPQLVEMKLASGMTSPGRLRDLADVQELIRTLNLPAPFSEQLNPYVRDKYAELWSAVKAPE
jgi:hypothetical protein